MPLATSKARIIGNHVRLFRNGDAFTVPTSGTAAQEAKPGSADVGWIDVGAVMELGVNHEREEREVFKPSTGQLKLHDVIETKRKITIKFTLQELQPLSYELLFGTGALTSSSTSHTPLAGGEKLFWVEVKQYDNNDVLINTVTLFCKLKVAGEVNFNDQLATVPVEAVSLYSSVAVGAL